MLGRTRADTHGRKGRKKDELKGGEGGGEDVEGKETKIERKRGSARPFQLLSVLLAARNTCPGERGSPDAGGQLRGDARPFSMRSGPYAGGGWRAVAEE